LQIYASMFAPEYEKNICPYSFTRACSFSLLLFSCLKYSAVDTKVTNVPVAFEKYSPRLPFRMLWYQIEPILAYNKLGEEEKVLEITSAILNNHNRAFSELYQLRGRIYMKRGDLDTARGEFEKALYYNKNYRLEEDELTVLN